MFACTKMNLIAFSGTRNCITKQYPALSWAKLWPSTLSSEYVLRSIADIASNMDPNQYVLITEILHVN